MTITITRSGSSAFYASAFGIRSRGLQSSVNDAVEQLMKEVYKKRDALAALPDELLTEDGRTQRSELVEALGSV